MSALFQTTKQNIGHHLKNTFEEGELAPPAVVKKSFTTAVEGKNSSTTSYNLDANISAGYLFQTTQRNAPRCNSQGLLVGSLCGRARGGQPRNAPYVMGLVRQSYERQVGDKAWA